MSRAGRETEDRFPNPDVVPAIAILGANASGKSNFLRALTTAFRMIRTSAMEFDAELPYTPYMLGAEADEPTTMQLVVRIDDIRYDYGFTYDRDRILAEWLRSWPKNRQRVLFERDADRGDVWYFGDSLTGANQTLARATRDDALLLSTARLVNHEQLGPIANQFSALIKTLSADNFPTIMESTLEWLNADAARLRLVAALVSYADLGIVSVTVEEAELPERGQQMNKWLAEAIRAQQLPEQLKGQLERRALSAKLGHSGPDGTVMFPMQWESTGTRNFLALLGPVLDRLATGGLLVIDEIDTSLHPRLVSELVRLFQSPRTNEHQAQLLLSTHDVTVIMNVGDYDVLRRDQVMFVSKDEQGSSRIEPLTDFHPRAGEVFSRNYLNGRYGGVPRIDREAFYQPWAEQDALGQ